MSVFASATLVVLSVALAAKKTMVMDTSVNVVNDVYPDVLPSAV